MELADKILELVRQKGEFFEGWENAPEDLKEQITSLVHEYIAKIGENLKVLDLFALPKEHKAYVYIHPGSRVVSIVFWEGDDESLAKEVALQVAAMNPQYISVEDIPAELLEQKKQEFVQELKDSGKPEDVIQRIVEGKLAKWYEEVVLLEQPYIRDESKKIKEVIGDKIKIVDFRRFSI